MPSINTSPKHRLLRWPLLPSESGCESQWRIPMMKNIITSCICWKYVRNRIQRKERQRNEDMRGCKQQQIRGLPYRNWNDVHGRRVHIAKFNEDWPYFGKINPLNTREGSVFRHNCLCRNKRNVNTDYTYVGERWLCRWGIINCVHLNDSQSIYV